MKVAFFMLLLSSLIQSIKSGASPTQKAKTGYKTNEQIEKVPSDNHPCNLTRTSMRISFPELKNQLFVNILGYREPNLVYLQQCRGFCLEQDSFVSCTPLKTKRKTFMMMFKTNSSGQDSSEGSQELVLDEHEECGCSCKDQLSFRKCSGIFNPLTCRCECKAKEKEAKACENNENFFWDKQTCTCVRKVFEKSIHQQLYFKDN